MLKNIKNCGMKSSMMTSRHHGACHPVPLCIDKAWKTSLIEKQICRHLMTGESSQPSLQTGDVVFHSIRRGSLLWHRPRHILTRGSCMGFSKNETVTCCCFSADFEGPAMVKILFLACLRQVSRLKTVLSTVCLDTQA